MYLNAYKMVEMVREGINEFTDAYVQGTDTTGAYRNVDIMDKINSAQQFIGGLLRIREPQAFFKKTTLTGVNSVYIPPGDFFKARRWEDANGIKVWPKTVDDISPTGQGIGDVYYEKANTFILDKTSASDVLTLYYIARLRDLDFGASAAGGALSVTLATTARPSASYYVGMAIYNQTDAWEDAISANTAARVCTVTGTWAASKYYGLIPELPEILHPLIPMKALLLMKSSYKSLKPPTVIELKDFQDAVATAFSDLLGTVNSDVDYTEMFR